MPERRRRSALDEVWSHIQLGKIFDITGQRERAVNEYRQACKPTTIPRALGTKRGNISRNPTSAKADGARA